MPVIVNRTRNDAALELNRRAANKQVVAVIIHGFTITHVITAAMLGPLAGTALTPLTVAMIVSIGTQCNAGFTVRAGMKIAAQFLGFLLGVSIAETIVGLFPFVGNIANACATGIVTEFLGWTAYIMIRDNIDHELSFWEKGKLLWAAYKLRKENAQFLEELKQARAQMTDSERLVYDNCMQVLTNKDSSILERHNALVKAQEILLAYNINIGI